MRERNFRIHWEQFKTSVAQATSIFELNLRNSVNEVKYKALVPIRLHWETVKKSYVFCDEVIDFLSQNTRERLSPISPTISQINLIEQVALAAKKHKLEQIKQQGLVTDIYPFLQTVHKIHSNSGIHLYSSYSVDQSKRNNTFSLTGNSIYTGEENPSLHLLSLPNRADTISNLAEILERTAVSEKVFVYNNGYRIDVNTQEEANKRAITLQFILLDSFSSKFSQEKYWIYARSAYRTEEVTVFQTAPQLSFT